MDWTYVECVRPHDAEVDVRGGGRRGPEHGQQLLPAVDRGALPMAGSTHVKSACLAAVLERSRRDRVSAVITTAAVVVVLYRD